MIHVGFLWHMHQPLYVDPASGEALLPWVRLHATRAYYDMAVLALEYPEVHQTFNLVPVLVKQLERLVAGGPDRYRTLSERPADGLREEDARFLIEMFFQANWHTLIYPNPGYRRLLELRGGEHIHADAPQRFSEQDLRDLQVWFNLAWFGFSARKRFPLIQALLAQQQGFSEAQKLQLLELQDIVVADILPLYREAQARGCIELSTTPFYHPILPLLCNSDSASVALPHLTLPQPAFRYPQDAQAQIERALTYFQEIFGRKPRGMWPSEGSVSPDVVPLMEKAGLHWFATSEGILHLSQLDENHPPVWQDPQHRPSVIQPYQVGGMAAFFRQLELSDRVGFTYSHMRGEDAANDLLHRIRQVVEQARPTGSRTHHPLVPIILDGENPWEHYPDGGESFLRHLYEGILRAPELSAITFSEYLDNHPAPSRISRLWSGSWIYSNFQIWIGHPEDVAGWERLREARETLERFTAEAEAAAPGSPELATASTGTSAIQVDAAWESLFAAEGSDWFWWFGDEFSSAAESDFDRLFRTHLQNVYKALGIKSPGNLEIPIKGMRRFQRLDPPRGIIRPTIDGRHSSWWEWEEAGTTQLQATGGAMARGTRLLSQLAYGYDQQHVFLRLDFGPDLFLHGDAAPELELLLVSPASLLLKTRLLNPHAGPRVPLKPGRLPAVRLEATVEPPQTEGKPDRAGPDSVEAAERGHTYLQVRALDVPDASHAGREGLAEAPPVKLSCGEMLELAIPRDCLKLNPSGELVFFLTLSLPDGARLRYPNRELFLLEVPELRSQG